MSKGIPILPLWVTGAFVCAWILLHIARADVTTQNGRTLISFDTPVLGFASNSSCLAVALDDTVVLYSLVVGADGIALNEQTKLTALEDLRPLLDFKLSDDNSVFLCTRKRCQVCSFDRMECLSMLDGASFTSVKGTLHAGGIRLRAVEGARSSGSIYSFESAEEETPKKANDVRAINQSIVAASFSTAKHSFFVGSALKIDIPQLMVMKSNNKRKYRSGIRMSRVCNSDQTTNLESRIDIALSWNGPGGEYFSSADYNQTVTAATLSLDKSKLLVAVRSRINSTIVQSIIEYDFVRLQERFDWVWNECQSIVDAKSTSRDCMDMVLINDPRCYLFTMSTNNQYPTCQKFNKATSTNNLDNCDLASTKVSAYRYGWLENYLPELGDIVARFDSNVGNILEIVESFDKRSLFVLAGNTATYGNIMRIEKGNALSKILWLTTALSLPIAPAAMLMEADIASKSLIYVDGNNVTSIKVSCPSFYPTCESIQWSDPLECAWCASLEGSGYTFSLKDSSACPLPDQRLRSICPPEITGVSASSGRYTINGKDLSRLDNLKVFTCKQLCAVSTFENSIVVCTFPTDPKCNEVRVTGNLGTYNNFTLVFLRNIGEPIEVTPDLYHTRTKMARVLASIIGVVIILLVLAAIWWLYRKYADRISRKVRHNKEINKYMLASSPDTTVAEGNMPYRLNKSSAELDKNHIYLVKHIGDGYSAKVFLAKYTVSPQETRAVAVKTVKTVNNANFEYGDIMREIELISKCSHKHIVEYIGHYSDPYGVHIVTEFMGGGDLHEYLINENYKPTIGDAFLYILQICEGMEYLWKQHIIHRDLAARNCMLDEERLVVKITDFGLCRTSNIDYEYISENKFQQLPFRWTAIECFENNSKFSDKSDVWSFGVVIWEIFARNLQPYEGLDSRGVKDFLKTGARLEAIAFCPEELYQNVILRCWDEIPGNRPNFIQLRMDIEKIFWHLNFAFPEYLASEYETPISNNLPQPSPKSKEHDNDGFITTPV